MCGRFTLTTDLARIQLQLGATSSDVDAWAPRFNIAPTQNVPVAVFQGQGHDGHRHLTLMRWGLIPFWSKDPAIAHKLINARSETAAEKPSFRNPFKTQRCLIPTDGFYEWQKIGKTKQPMRIFVKSREVFSMAGLWDSWKNPESGELLDTFTILTCGANSFVTPIHDRMPAILSPEAETLWLDPKSPPEKLLKLVTTAYPAREMDAYPVSTLVNNPRNDAPECALQWHP